MHRSMDGVESDEERRGLETQHDSPPSTGERVEGSEERAVCLLAVGESGSSAVVGRQSLSCEREVSERLRSQIQTAAAGDAVSRSQGSRYPSKPFYTPRARQLSLSFSLSGFLTVTCVRWPTRGGCC